MNLDYKEKYLKYKGKYLLAKLLKGGVLTQEQNEVIHILNNIFVNGKFPEEKNFPNDFPGKNFTKVLEEIITTKLNEASLTPLATLKLKYLIACYYGKAEPMPILLNLPYKQFIFDKVPELKIPEINSEIKVEGKIYVIKSTYIYEKNIIVNVIDKKYVNLTQMDEKVLINLFYEKTIPDIFNEDINDPTFIKTATTLTISE